jgi:DNA-directed RNA polymerase subunit RPC12/RpoP
VEAAATAVKGQAAVVKGAAWVLEVEGAEERDSELVEVGGLPEEMQLGMRIGCRRCRAKLFLFERRRRKRRWWRRRRRMTRW